MDDVEVIQWVIDARVRLNEFIRGASADAKPGAERLEVFHRLLAVNNEMVKLVWDINTARDAEHLGKI